MDAAGQERAVSGPDPSFLMPPQAIFDFESLGVRCVPGDQHPLFREAARVVRDCDSEIFERLQYLALRGVPVRLESSPGQFLNVCFSREIWLRLREEREDPLGPGNDGDYDMPGSENSPVRRLQRRSDLRALLHPLQSPTTTVPDSSKSPTSASSDNADALSRGRSPSIASQGSEMSTMPQKRRAKSFTGRDYR
jgi:hypothetical protein